MPRATVCDIAKAVDMHPNTIRNWTDKGLIEHKRDFRGWRWFEDPVETIRTVQMLLNGEKIEGSEKER